MRRRSFLLAMGALSPLSLSAAKAASLSATQTFAATQSPSVVLFTKDVSPDGMLRLCRALKSELHWSSQGKTAIKMSFESPSAPRLSPDLVKVVAGHFNGTLVDCNGFSPPRDQTQSHLQLVKEHGYAEIAPIDILDAEGTMDLPVTGGYHLQYARTGSHFANYDNMVSLVRFKAHYLPRYGGTLKNLSICMGSLSGKAIIHSAGKIEDYYSSTDDRTTAESMADAAQAAVFAKKGRWAFIQVLDAVDPMDQCENTRNLGDIGLMASLDPVALDQASIDITFSQAPDENTMAQWHQTHMTYLPQLAERIGVGSTRYHLKTIDG